MAIKPVSLPAAAGLDFGKGDVRHFSPGDAVDVPGMSNPTRYLAQRDNAVAEKLNEVIGVVNNQEQFVPLTLVPTVVPPNEEIVVANYRIPAGFESRVLNAAVSARPVSTNIELNIYYAQGFGNTTGTDIVTTAGEFTGGVQFYQVGEFIVTLKNTGPISLEMSASVMLTVRPLGAQGTLLVGTIIQGPAGSPGMTGPPGPAGPSGSGGAGSPGMVWQGAWTNGHTYSANDVVSFALFGSIVSSYICRVPNTASLGSNDPGTDDVVTWNAVALGGATGVGVQGPPGLILNAPTLAFTPFSGTLITGSDFVSGDTTVDGYVGNLAASGTYTNVSIAEFKITSGTTAGNTVGFLFGNPQFYFTGHGTIRLPRVTDGAAFNYSNAYINVTVCDNGTSIPNVAVNGQTLVSWGTTATQTIISSGVTAGGSITVYGTSHDTDVIVSTGVTAGGSVTVYGTESGTQTIISTGVANGTDVTVFGTNYDTDTVVSTGIITAEDVTVYGTESGTQTIVSTGIIASESVTAFGTKASQTLISWGTVNPPVATVTNTHSVSIASLSSPASDFVITVIDPYPVKIQLNIFGAQNV